MPVPSRDSWTIFTRTSYLPARPLSLSLAHPPCVAKRRSVPIGPPPSGASRRFTSPWTACCGTPCVASSASSTRLRSMTTPRGCRRTSHSTRVARLWPLRCFTASAVQREGGRAGRGGGGGHGFDRLDASRGSPQPVPHTARAVRCLGAFPLRGLGAGRQRLAPMVGGRAREGPRRDAHCCPGFSGHLRRDCLRAPEAQARLCVPCGSPGVLGADRGNSRNGGASARQSLGSRGPHGNEELAGGRYAHTDRQSWRHRPAPFTLRR